MELTLKPSEIRLLFSYFFPYSVGEIFYVTFMVLCYFSSIYSIRTEYIKRLVKTHASFYVCFL